MKTTKLKTWGQRSKSSGFSCHWMCEVVECKDTLKKIKINKSWRQEFHFWLKYQEMMWKWLQNIYTCIQCISSSIVFVFLTFICFCFILYLCVKHVVIFYLEINKTKFYLLTVQHLSSWLVKFKVLHRWLTVW